MLRLDEKNAIITGGGSGIGKGIAEMFAERGAHVQIFEVDEVTAEATVSEIVSAGGSATARVCDITDQAGVKSQVEAIVAERGQIDILVNNAGIAHVGSATTTEEADFDRVMAVNVKGVYNCCYAVIPHMPQGSAILNIASTVAWFGLAERFAYSTSKGAVVALTYSGCQGFCRQGNSL